MPKVVLLVEDDEDNRDLIMFVIERSQMDIELMMAENGQDALEQLKRKRPDLILMDMQMPVMDGFTAVPLIKGDPAYQDIPIIAFTAQARAEDKQRTLEMGCVEHYTKPMDPEELLSLIQKYLSNPAAVA